MLRQGRRTPIALRPAARGLRRQDISRLLDPDSLGTFTVITGDSSGLSADIRDRMPVWLAPGQAEEWIAASAGGTVMLSRRVSGYCSIDTSERLCVIVCCSNEPDWWVTVCSVKSTTSARYDRWVDPSAGSLMEIDPPQVEVAQSGPSNSLRISTLPPTPNCCHNTSP